MFKRLNNLKIKQKFAVIIVPLIVIILGFDYLQVKYNYLDYDDGIRLNKAITVGVEINHVVHELQKERSISSGFLANNGDNFVASLEKQRSRTDSTLEQYLNEIAANRLQKLVDLHKEDLEELNSAFDELKNLRGKIDSHNVSSEESIDEFSKINNLGLNTVIKLIDETRDKEIAQQVHAMIYFLKAKEFASVERAIGTQVFSHSHIGFDLYNRFTTLVASQEAYTESFQIIADSESKDFHQSTVKGKGVDEVARLRQVIFANDSINADPEYWYKASTAKINQLKIVEDFMADNIQNRADEQADDAIRDFWSFLVLDLIIGAITFWLMSIVVTNLLKNVKTLEAFTKKVSTGDLSKKVVVDSKDELGQYARTFNQMVHEIRKSHFALRKQRDKAKYLYENIYGVSLAVFENIHQGIFLLDREFKISKFHSKVMNSIFSDEKIAGENFANFMRPLILPRELEALEMFMRHLFNDDMDEDVVTQLNPIDQVKIHTEQNGVVATKYIRVDFTRIHRKEKIQSIMVTVSDETESILLQQHLSEAEKKKQQETERVLSILKIDPSILRGFLHNSSKMLKSISYEYEKNENDEYSALLSFTMDVVHNLKGNAVVIGMDLMSNKFHEIEEALVKLKSKEVRGKDFLAILYEIDEADRMINDISDMLHKIVNIYKKFPAEGNSVSNIMLIDALERGADLIAKEVGKSVELVFENNENIVIPEEYIEPFKDVMIQLIRNSIVHGVELPNERIKAGKVTQGTIKVGLERTAKNDLVVNYSDDGAGLDQDKIKRNAIERGLKVEFEVEKMEEEQVWELIFLEGFSTSEKSNKHAGRGQGMHLVKSIIEDQKGSFKFNNEKGKSFGLTVQFPDIGKNLVEDE